MRDGGVGYLIKMFLEENLCNYKFVFGVMRSQSTQESGVSFTKSLRRTLMNIIVTKMKSSELYYGLKSDLEQDKGNHIHDCCRT